MFIHIFFLSVFPVVLVQRISRPMQSPPLAVGQPTWFWGLAGHRICDLGTLPGWPVCSQAGNHYGKVSQRRRGFRWRFLSPFSRGQVWQSHKWIPIHHPRKELPEPQISQITQIKIVTVQPVLKKAWDTTTLPPFLMGILYRRTAVRLYSPLKMGMQGVVFHHYR